VFFDNPYRILGVPRQASPNEIKKCYRKLCLLYHPDKNAQKSARQQKNCEKKFKQIRQAYDAIITSSTLGGMPNRSRHRRNAVELVARELWYFLCRPGLFFSELKRLNLFAMGTPYATKGPPNLGTRSIYLQKVAVPLEDLYRGVPSFRLPFKDTLIERYKASIRGNCFLFSLYQASIFAIPLLKHTHPFLAAFVGLYVVHGTTPVPNPGATYATRIKRGETGGLVRFSKWREIELVFWLRAAEHPIYKLVGMELHAEVTLTSAAASGGCTRTLPALDPKTEEDVTVVIPANRFSYEKEQESHRQKKAQERQRSKQHRNDKEDAHFSPSRPYDNTIRIRGRGWPIQQPVGCSDEYSYGDLIVTIRVQKPRDKRR
jgi:hypothetical protein